LTYNLRSSDELRALAPTFPWSALLGAGEVDYQTDYVVAELDAVAALGSQFSTVPVATWKSYLKFHYLDSVASVLPKAFDEERFDFFGRKLNGQLVQRERWKRAVRAVNGAMGEAVGQLYVARYFPPASKAQMLTLVENLRSAYAVRIKAAPWMSEVTKQLALQKLAAFRLKIAYPDHWRDYSTLEVRSGDAFGNAVRGQVFAYEYDLKRLHQRTDRDEWGMTPQRVNAYYNPMFNEIVFPAAILQPPFFDPKADAAVNYGGIGAVIGHEMSHGFDDQGAKSDAHGVLRPWWQPEDARAFKTLGDRLAEQYSGFTALPGVKLNGRLTLGENLGDLGGVTVALEAYRLSLQGQTAPILDGWTGEQRFFLSWAQAWRMLKREEALRTQALNDPHSPAQFRVNGPLRNTDAWYAAFDVKPGDALYLPAAQRIRVW
jgi:putative endopeptidase